MVRILLEHGILSLIGYIFLGLSHGAVALLTVGIGTLGVVVGGLSRLEQHSTRFLVGNDDSDVTADEADDLRLSDEDEDTDEIEEVDDDEDDDEDDFEDDLDDEDDDDDSELDDDDDSELEDDDEDDDE